MSDARIETRQVVGGGAPSGLAAFASDASAWFGAIAVAAIFLMLLYEIVSRYVFSSPTGWTNDYSTYVMVGLAYVGAAYAHSSGANVRVELFLERMSENRQRVLSISAAWLSLLFVSIATWQVTIYGYGLWLHGARSVLDTVPRWLLYVPIAVGLFGLLIAIVEEIAELETDRRNTGAAFATLLVLAAPLAASLLGSAPIAISGLGIDLGASMIFVALVVSCVVLSGARMAVFVVAQGTAVALIFMACTKLSAGYSAALLCLTLVALLMIGMRIAFALGFVAVLAVYFMLPINVAAEVASRAYNSMNSFSFTAVPMYVFMGLLLMRSGVASNLFSGILVWLRRIPGGLAYSGIGASAVFSAVSGSSVATAATIATVACPEMKSRGYDERLAYGSVAAGGTLGILIPPSIPMIIYGTTVGVSVSKLFLAGIIPGLLLTLIFCLVVFAWALIRPASIPRHVDGQAGGHIAALLDMAPVLAIIGFIFASIYAGVVTPTEAGVLGASAALLIGIARRAFTVASVVEALKETAKVCAFTLLIVFGASLLSFIFDFLSLAQLIVSSFTTGDVPAWLIMLMICLAYMLLGMFIDPISMMLVTLPIVYPLVTSLGYDGVWFGVLLVILMEMGLVTPPVGMNLFIIQGIVKDARLAAVAAGALPFIVGMVGLVILLFAFPQIALFLPEIAHR